MLLAFFMNCKELALIFEKNKVIKNEPEEIKR